MKEFYTHWIIGIICAIVWCFGDRLNIPTEAIAFAQGNLGIIIGHAIATAQQVLPSQPDSQPATTTTEGK